ncbi:putative integrase/resolvase recombinase protein [uncultured Alphaproteobacteria bacterium]|uniref:Putative integrase/resolvase recombinase protein n=1 Tax=uncultured Alphaproteobacteria bacterium TaxID=91750 RepID=A0A212K0N8_9PROT|nr:putative integrase/resolvase recombinase protein [uncultured Alphaproteobacteria bacterium]
MAFQRLSHLVRRGDVFAFRMAVPRSLWARCGLREIKGSLKTGDPFTARMRCRTLSDVFERLIRELPAMPDLTPDVVKSLIRSYFERCLSTAEEVAYLAPQDQSVDLVFEAGETLAESEQLRKLLVAHDYDPVTRNAANEVLAQVGASRKTVGLEQFDKVCNGVLRARIETRRILAAKLRGDYAQAVSADPLFIGIEATEMPPLPGDVPAEERSLGSVANRYCAMKKDKEWVGKTYLDHRRVLNLVIELVGEKRPVATLALDDVRLVRDSLMELPSNYMKSKAMQGVPLKEILASKAKGETISLKTQDKYFSMFRTFLKWCVAEGYLAAMPGPGLKISGVSKLDAKDARYPFSGEQLQKLFTSPLFTGCKSAGRRSEPGDQVIRDGKFWIPIIGLYSGMRLGEIVQLLATDIKEHGEIPYFDVCRGEGKTIKTESSLRCVPVHPVLIDLGFLAHVDRQRKKGPNGRVFPDINPGKDGYFSAAFSKWFARYAEDVGVKTAKTTFHSFRHNFKDALDYAEVSEATSKALMGHSQEGVHDKTYGKPKNLPLLAKSLSKIEYPIDLDLLREGKGASWSCS